MPAHEFEFVTCLPPKNPQARTAVMERFVAALKSRPGEWCKWPGPGSFSAGHVRSGELRPFRGGDFDAVLRNGVVYVCYLPEQRGGRDV